MRNKKHNEVDSNRGREEAFRFDVEGILEAINGCSVGILVKSRSKIRFAICRTLRRSEFQACSKYGHRASKKEFCALRVFMHLDVVFTAIKQVVSYASNHAKQKLYIRLAPWANGRFPGNGTMENNLLIRRRVEQIFAGSPEVIRRIRVERGPQGHREAVPVRFGIRPARRDRWMTFEIATRFERILEARERQEKLKQ
jgi:hypothetical protein